MSDISADEARRLLDGTSMGDWALDQDEDGRIEVVDKSGEVVARVYGSPADAELIAAAPSLAAEVERLSAENERPSWIIELVGSPDPQHFGPFVDEDDALGWGYEHLADFEPEDWEPYELSLKPPESTP